jgi:hypothetical protein
VLKVGRVTGNLSMMVTAWNLWVSVCFIQLLATFTQYAALLSHTCHYPLGLLFCSSFLWSHSTTWDVNICLCLFACLHHWRTSGRTARTSFVLFTAVCVLPTAVPGMSQGSIRIGHMHKLCPLWWDLCGYNWRDVYPKLFQPPSNMNPVWIIAGHWQNPQE